MLHIRTLCAASLTLSGLVIATAFPAVTACAAPEQAGHGSVPSEAQTITDRTLTEGLGHLLADGAPLFHLPAASGATKALVYSWSGNNYKASHAAFVKTKVDNMFTGQGCTVTHVDAHVDNVPNIFDEEKYGLGSLQVAPFTSLLDYFYVKSAKTGETLVGVWIQQDDDSANLHRMLLAMAPAGKEAIEKAPSALPGVSGDEWLVKDLKHASKGMPAPPAVAFPGLAAKPRTVRGWVRDSGGKPIVGAHLIAQSSAAGGFRTSYEARTNAQGLYEINLPVGVCKVVNADCRVSFHDQSLLLPLDPADGTRDDFDSRPGHVENFVLRASGSAGPDGGDYGAPMRVLTYDAPAGSTTELTLTPVGPMLDGSKGRTLVFRWKSRPDVMHSSETFLGGIPIGQYKLTAKVFDGGEELPMRAKKTFHSSDEDEPQLESALNVEFESIKAGNLANLGESGIQRYEVTLRP